MNQHWKKYIMCVLAVCTLLVGASVQAAVSYPFLPLNVEAWVETGENGPELQLWVQNNNNIAVGQFMFSVELYDSNGNPARYFGVGDNTFYGAATGIYLPEYKNDLFAWEIGEYQGAVSAKNVRLQTVRFMGGQTWTYSPAVGYSYEADFKWENEMMEDGSVEMYYDHSVHLFDTSLGSMSRDWYIWSDAQNCWLWFSDEMAPDCYIWNKGAAIKLVINKNPALYTIKTFQVAMRPFITMRHMGNEEAEIVDKYTLDAGRTFAQTEGNWNVALWDDNDYGQKRDWYVWDDTQQTWVWISGERGPAYKVMEEGTYSIKLVYDGNSQNEQIISFTAVRAEAEGGELQHGEEA